MKGKKSELQELKDSIERAHPKIVRDVMRQLCQNGRAVTLREIEREINRLDGKKTLIMTRKQILQELAGRSSDHPDFVHGYEDLYYCIKERGVERWGVRKI